MSWFWWLLGILVIVIWVATVVNIIQRRHERSGSKTAAWIIIILVFPVVGSLVYFLVNGASGAAPARAAEIDRMTGERY